MKLQPRLIVALGLSAVMVKAVGHPLQVVESAIRKEERDVQFVDVQAPAFHLADARGRPVGLVDLRGKVVVLNFVDSRHSEAGRAHMALMAKLQAMVNTAAMQDQVQFVSIATDDKDVESALATTSGFARTYGFDTRNWEFLYGMDAQPPGTARRLASAYGLDSANEGAEKDIVTHVIDQAGRLRARFYGLEFEPVNLVSYVNALLNDDHSRQ